jgi:hypothetical protein
MAQYKLSGNVLPSGQVRVSGFLFCKLDDFALVCVLRRRVFIRFITPEVSPRLGNIRTGKVKLGSLVQ